jgi:hypothetical protein
MGHDAVAALAIRGSSDAIVLLNPDACRGGPFRNVLRLSMDGVVIWQAQLPGRQNDDSYVSVRWMGERLVANTWSAYLVHLDADSGQLLEVTFTK